MAERTLTEREAFHAMKYFIAQFNEREKSPMIEMWLGWMQEGSRQHDPLETDDPAQWHDWVESVDRVISERRRP